jgi:hypothetical protein
VGERFLFVCDTCSYQAEVAGGPDAGMAREIQTATCDACKELVDIVTGGRGVEPSRGKLNRCPNCASERWTPWGAEETYRTDGNGISWRIEPKPNEAWGPCPKCSGEMLSRGPTAIWD